MPVSYRIEGSLLHLSMTGTYPATDAIDALRRAAADPDLPIPVTALVDLRESGGNPSAGELRLIAAAIGSLTEFCGARLALVVTSELHFGLARMLEAMSEKHGIGIRAFREVDKARRWLAEDPRREGLDR